MKKNYEKMFCGVVFFGMDDVVTTSVGGKYDNNDNYGDIGDFSPFIG